MLLMPEQNKSHMDDAGTKKNLVIMLEQNKTHLLWCQKSDVTNFSTSFQIFIRRFSTNALPCQSFMPLFETEACGDVEFTLMLT